MFTTIQTAATGFITVDAATVEIAQLEIFKRHGVAIVDQVVWTADELHRAGIREAVAGKLTPGSEMFNGADTYRVTRLAL